jgi:hypothetical protein
MRRFEKKFFFYPSYVPMRFFCGRARARTRDRKNFFLPVLHVLHQNETTAG